ncbi:MAG: hypothetical protein NVV62_01925 [Terricaulis sp.]|nr:hypothetical protein [Terricaulis sp.]
MTASGDEDLANLIVREQRGFRRMLMVGLVTLIFMALLSIGMGFYFWFVSQRLDDATARLQFDSRRAFMAQNTQLAAQERRMARLNNEMRAAMGQGAELAASPENIAQAHAAVQAFFMRGHRLSSAEQRAISQFSRREGVAELSPNLRALMGAAWLIINFENSGEPVRSGEDGLNRRLGAANAQLEAARADPALATLARAGQAWILFAEAGAANYTPAACEPVFAAIEGLHNGVAAPLPLYWRAQCERKLGRALEALGNYALSLEAVAPTAEAMAETPGRREAEAELQLALDAYHGVGTTLIATADVADDDPRLAAAVAIAQQRCGAPAPREGRSARMLLAEACLEKAIGLRRALNQLPQQVSGTAENLSFVYLRDGDYDAAFRNTVAVSQTGLFAWNEAMRAFSAANAYEASRAERRRAGAEAQRNVAMFSVSQFNICELRSLLSADHYAEIEALIAAQHRREIVACEAAPG